LLGKNCKIFSITFPVPTLNNKQKYISQCFEKRLMPLNQ